jgi:hypothetical protein
MIKILKIQVKNTNIRLKFSTLGHALVNDVLEVVKVCFLG